MRISWFCRLTCFFIGLLLCGQLLIQAQELDPDETLLQIRKQVAAAISRLPNYLCTETVERQTFFIADALSGRAAGACNQMAADIDKSPKDLKLVATDRLRLDVALSRQSEMYSWVGEGRFDDRNLSEIVKHGTTSTGAFGSFLHAIFVSHGAIFTFKGRSNENGRSVLQYDFAVPLEASGYTVSNETSSERTGYTGSFTADAKTLDLLELAFRTDPLPPELKICRSSSTLRYTRIQMKGVEVLLPSEVLVRMLGTDGHESRNRTVFTGCHQFMGESKLIFDEPPAEIGSGETAKALNVKLGDGLKMSIALAQPIDPQSAAAGDPVKGVLAKAAKDSASGLTIPKGTKVNGRIVGLLSYDQQGASNLELGLKWESLEIGGIGHQMKLAVRAAIGGSSHLALIHSHFPDIPAMNRPEQPGVGFFLFHGVPKDYAIPAGFEAEWVTVAASAKADSTQGEP